MENFLITKEQFKNELKKAYEWGQENEYQYHINNDPHIDFEQYYYENYERNILDDDIPPITKYFKK